MELSQVIATRRSSIKMGEGDQQTICKAGLTFYYLFVNLNLDAAGFANLRAYSNPLLRPVNPVVSQSSPNHRTAREQEEKFTPGLCKGSASL